MKKLPHMNNLRLYMKQLLSNISMTLLVLVMLFFSAYIALNIMTSDRYYDCSYSEISPDYSIKMKEQCRNLRMKNDE